MSDKNKKSTKPRWKKALKIFFLMFFLLAIIAAGAAAGVVIGIAKDAPKINPVNIGTLLDQTSFILDPDGNVLEKIQTEEYRTIVSIEQMPQHLKDAFIAIEDERFDTHIGVDIKGIIKSSIDNFKAGQIVRGASTITQQLAKNLYLTTDKKYDRKIKEAYLALQIEKALTKDQILESYLNRIYLGQGAYGVQEAAQTYFSKNVWELSIAESAVIAGITKNPSRFSLYQVLNPEDFDNNKHIEIAQMDILGEKYIAIFNEEAINRQKIVLSKMLQLEKISESTYDAALNEDILNKTKPGEKKIQGISSYFNDYVKMQVIEALMNELDYSREEAEEELYTGGLKIYASMDLKLQKELEDIYNNFTEVLLGDIENIKAPAMISWRLNKTQDIVDENGRTIFYRQENVLDSDFNLIIERDSYQIEDGSLIISNAKLRANKNNIDIADYYSINERKNLVTYKLGGLSVPNTDFSVRDDGAVIISKGYIMDNHSFYSIDDEENLIINEKYFSRQKDGIVQPQSASVVIDYRTGQIKALVGGRDIEGNKILNRATSSARQPGSTIKPLAVYLPALDNGYTAATPIDDIPYYDDKGRLWPKNWYTGYRGIHTLRRSVEQSVNVNSVKTLQAVGIATSMEYLSRMGIINKENPSKDNFIASSENKFNNDENLSALGLGGMTKGLSPLDMTAAYGSIANQGVYIKPISFTKILDKNDNLLLEVKPKETTVVSPQVAFIMGDILRTTVAAGIAGKAQVPDMPTSGKTGTTQDKADAWFVGYTGYYVTGLWIGNDAPQIRLNEGSAMAAKLWKIVMTRLHEGLEAKNFEQPEGIVAVNICNQSGKLPTELCNRDPRGSTVRREFFVQGTQPTDFCDAHVELEIDTSNNKIANEYCPKDLVEQKVFVQRNPIYDPEGHNGIIPSDFQYAAPLEECDEHDQDNWLLDWLNNLFNNNGEDNENQQNDNDIDNGNEINNDLNNGNGDSNDNNDNYYNGED